MKIKTLALIFAFAIPAAASAEDTPQTPSDKTTDTTKSGDANNKTGDANKTGDTKSADTNKSGSMKLTDAEQQFVAHVHHVNMMEIDMGKMAQRMGSSAAVKRHGETIVRDHQAADKQVTALAKKRGIAKLPTAMKDDDPHKADMKMQMEQMASLKKMKGAEFDRQYLQMMIDGHEKELVRNEAAMATAVDPELRTMLETRRTTLRRHADAARELQKGNEQAGGSTSKTDTTKSDSKTATAPKK